MELLLILAGFWVLFWGIAKLIDRPQGGSSSSTSGQAAHTSSHSAPSRPAVPKSEHTFRPASNRRPSSGIHFRDSSLTGVSTSISITPEALSGLHDAFTGAPLNKSLGLYQCLTCKVFYHRESVQVLREANNSQCVSCRSTNIVSIVPGAAPTSGKDYAPNVVTLENYRMHVGSVVTFEGHVHAVNESRRGNDFAVMFESKSWVHGFKLVFFRGAVQKVGGPRYIKSLHGKTVRVRGLIVQHPRFGYEIIISEKSMILTVN